MRINASDLAFAGHQSLFQLQERDETLKHFNKFGRPYLKTPQISFGNHKPLYAKLPSDRILNRPDKVTLSNDALNQRAQPTPISNQVVEVSEGVTPLLSDAEDNIVDPFANQAAGQSKSITEMEDSGMDAKSSMLEKLIEAMTGKQVDILKLEDLDLETESARNVVRTQSLEQSVRYGRNQTTSLSYDYHEEVHLKESVDLEAKGTIVTADGQSFEFDLDIELTREFFSQTDISVDAQSIATPKNLVLDFAGLAEELTDVQFDFDLKLELEKLIGEVGENRKSSRGCLKIDRRNASEQGQIKGRRNWDQEAAHPAADKLPEMNSESNAVSAAPSKDWVDQPASSFEHLQVMSFQFKASYQSYSYQSLNIEAIYASTVAQAEALANESIAGEQDPLVLDAAEAVTPETDVDEVASSNDDSVQVQRAQPAIVNDDPVQPLAQGVI